jgi:Fur family ferric uptake transcriptional regulator
MLDATGERATPARAMVLSVLLASERPLSHLELEKKLQKQGKTCDRVTLYRVLDWLVSRGLAHKVPGEDRVWRFNAVSYPPHSHAHFQCRHCGQVYCLEDVRPVFALSLPPGFQYEHADLRVQGTCPTCAV